MYLRFFMSILFIPAVIYASERGPLRQSTNIVASADFAWFNPNRINSVITNRGELVSARLTGTSAMEWPAGSDKTLSYQAGLWIVGKVSGEIRTAVADFGTDFSPGTYAGAPGNQYDPEFRVYVIDRKSAPGDADFDEWPISLGAPSDTNGLPLLLGDKTSWAVFNDADTIPLIRVISSSRSPLGIEVRQTIWGYDRYGAFGDMLFVKWQVYNMSDIPIDSMYIGFWDDADIGDSHDVLMGVRPDANLGYAYKNVPDPQYGTQVPATGFDFLQTPIISSAGDTAYSFGKEIIDYKNIPIAAFSKIFPRDPSTQSEFWNRMLGLLTDGSPIVNPITFDTTTYQYTGDPTSETGWLDPIGGNSRFIMSVGPLSMAPGDSQEVICAFIITRGTDGINSVERMFEADSIAQIIFDAHFESHEVSLLSHNDGNIVMGQDTINWTASSEISNNLLVAITAIPLEGEEFLIADDLANDGIYIWNSEDVPDGFYTLRIDAYDSTRGFFDLSAADISDSMIIIDNEINDVPNIIIKSDLRGIYSGLMQIDYLAADVDAESLDISIWIRNTSEHEYFLVDSTISNTGTYFFDTYPHANDPSYILRFTVSDGDTSASVNTNNFDIINERLETLSGVFTNIIGVGNDFTVNIVDSSALTDHDYQTDFYLKYSFIVYSVRDLETDEIVAEDVQMDRFAIYQESPLFGGIRLVVPDLFSVTAWKTDWINVSSDTSSYNITYDHSRGSPGHPADYEVRFVSGTGTVTGNDNLAVPFRVWNITEEPPLLVELEHFPQNGVWSSGDQFQFHEELTPNSLHPTWRLYFEWDESDTPPQPGDVLKLITKKPHKTGDELVFNTNGAPTVGIEEDQNIIPTVYKLSQNFPNPFNPVTKISYSLPVDSDVSLLIYNLRGQEVARLIDGVQLAGNHNLTWNASNFASGIYFYRLQAGDFVQTRKMVLLK